MTSTFRDDELLESAGHSGLATSLLDQRPARNAPSPAPMLSTSQRARETRLPKEDQARTAPNYGRTNPKVVMAL